MTQPDPAPAPGPLSTAHASDAQITAAVLAAVDAQRDAALELLDRLVTIPSVGGSEAECEIQHVVADVLHGEGFDVDHAATGAAALMLILPVALIPLAMAGPGPLRTES